MGSRALFIRLSKCNLCCGCGTLREEGKATWTCLDGRTAINKFDHQKKIRDVEVGDMVMGYNEVTQVVEPTEVIRKIEHEVMNTTLYTITTKSGIKLKNITAEHPFYVKNAYVATENLKIGDEIYHIDYPELAALQSKFRYPLYSDNMKEKMKEGARNRDTSYMRTFEYGEAVKEGQKKAGVSVATSLRMKLFNPMKKPEVVKKNWEAHTYKSKMEQKLEELFQEAALPIEHVGAGKLWLNKRNPDFRVTGQKKVIEVYFGSFQYKNPDGSVYYRDSEWEKATKDHYSKYGFSTLFLNMDSAGFPEGQTGSDYISMARKEKLLSMVGNFVHNGDQIISIEKKVHKSKKVYNLECSPHKNFFANRLLSHNCDSWLQMKNFTEYTPAGLITEIEKQFGEEYINKIFTGEIRIVVTGGEPALYAEPVIQFLDMMDKLAAAYQLQVLKWDRNQLRPPTYEVETNGTIFTGSSQFYERFSFVNCSPKLASSGMAKDKRIVPFALIEITKHPYSSFKFVVSKDEDWNEIRQDFIDPFLSQIHPTRIFLMPAGQTKEDLEETRKVCWRMAEATGCLMTSRLQIETFGAKPGV